MAGQLLQGDRHVFNVSDDNYPQSLRNIYQPPENLFVIGNEKILEGGLAVVGSRRITPYGEQCTTQFTTLAAQRGVTIISGGARGCDTVAHKAALETGAPTVVVLGCGCDVIYPPENQKLFQEIIDAGGAIVSEYDWKIEGMPWMFRARARLIASIADAVLITEASLPSGTFAVVDNALEAGKDVLAIPGPVTSPHSLGTNKLIYQGATPIYDEAVFNDQLTQIFELNRVEHEFGIDAMTAAKAASEAQQSTQKHIHDRKVR